MVIRMDQWGKVLSTRDLGANIRQKIIVEFNKQDQDIVIDFINVEGINQSCADEVFGKMLLEIGLDNFKKRIKFNNMNDTISSVVKYVMASRWSNLKNNAIN
ncbi:DUF4325 domain-containing protein [Crassaminicella thermophila]|uniref:DUF4325 domain-containing protein n=1 Tax=Crassaminicella thermophila TaxID=2599308 RepID=A0A5C0SH06_CRATE|nr:STAS-like domain-containing protein [Crassaminicella thermophila]QEK12562.1 DUF4325 domain-containing protein [Crassaminicella thermophila]QEK12694.1 DUF4325 domain-containing protein [Crassaminicella thermophila]